MEMALDGLTQLKKIRPLTMPAVKERLLALKPLSFGSIAATMRVYGTIGRAGQILQELNPERYRMVCRQELVYEGGVEFPVIAEALAEIDLRAPLDLDMIEGGIGGLADLAYISLIPVQLGYPMGWDEWEEISQDPTGCDDVMAINIFFNCLRLGQPETFNMASDHFGWGVYWNAACNLPVDWERFCELLHQKKMGFYINAINTVWYDTNNPYFDMNPFDEMSFDNFYYDFDLEGFRSLEEAWQDAQPIRDDLARAIKDFTINKKAPRRLLNIWTKAVAESDKRLVHILAETYD
ncbi:MAG: hypothetical protein CL609_23710 [Anaerolineaceae bacterium]|nr:hypothetical protein [Anaerolineaceae bacterium]